MDSHNDAWYEAERGRHLPTPVRVLLIGESRPKSGRFFYTCDSLTDEVMKAFALVCPAAPRSCQPFLQYFETLGFYLDDVCQKPVNGLPKPERRKQWKHGLGDLVARVGKMKPKPAAIVVIMRQIAPCVEQGLKGPPNIMPPFFRVVSFPGMGNQARFREEFAEVLRELKAAGLVC